MKDTYWFRKLDLDNYIDICFSNDSYNLINIFMHMVPIMELRSLLEKTNSVEIGNTNSSNYHIFYEGCSILSSRDYIFVYIGDEDELNNICISLEFFRNILQDYIKEYDKMMEESNGLSK